MKKKERESVITIKEGSADQIIPALQTLKSSPGWKIIQEILQVNIQKIEKAILDSDESWTPAELTKWRDMRFFEKKLLELPDTIIHSYEVEAQPQQNIILDPYEGLTDNAQ